MSPAVQVRFGQRHVLKQETHSKRVSPPDTRVPRLVLCRTFILPTRFTAATTVAVPKTTAVLSRQSERERPCTEGPWRTS